MPKKPTQPQVVGKSQKTSKRRPSAKKTTGNAKQTRVLKKLTLWQKAMYYLQVAWSWIRARFRAIMRRRDFYLRRRPHRSFRLTRRRDYARSLKLPGYFAFTIEVWATLWRYKWTFLLLGIVFFALVIAFGLLGSQQAYEQIKELLDVTQPEGMFDGAVGEVSKAGVVLLTATMSMISGDLQPWQQFTLAFFALYVWLTVVWLLRNIMAGKRVKLRDGLYSAGAPILPTFLVVMILLIQLIPMAVAIIVASAGWSSGFIQEGVASMAAGLGLALVVVASLYWVVSTFFALVIVTLPGMYPFRAIAIAGDLVIGRRLRLVYRIVWLLLSIISWWVVVMIPVILLDSFVKSKFEVIAGAPVVPLTMLGVATFTIVWTATYIYLLYRKVVDDDASPA